VRTSARCAAHPLFALHGQGRAPVVEGRSGVARGQGVAGTASSQLRTRVRCLEQLLSLRKVASFEGRRALRLPTVGRVHLEAASSRALPV